MMGYLLRCSNRGIMQHFVLLASLLFIGSANGAADALLKGKRFGGSIIMPAVHKLTEDLAEKVQNMKDNLAQQIISNNSIHIGEGNEDTNKLQLKFGQLGQLTEDLAEKVQNNKASIVLGQKKVVDKAKTRNRIRSGAISLEPFREVVQRKPTSELNVTRDLYTSGNLLQPRDLRGYKKEGLDPLGLDGVKPLTLETILDKMDLSEEARNKVGEFVTNYPKEDRYQCPGIIKTNNGEVFVVRPKKSDKNVKRVKFDNRTIHYDFNGDDDSGTTWKISPIAEEFKYLAGVNFDSGRKQKEIDNIFHQLTVFNPVAEENMNDYTPNKEALKIYSLRGRNKGNGRPFDITDPRIDLGGVIDGMDNSGMLSPFTDILSGNGFAMSPAPMLQYDMGDMPADRELRAEEKTFDGSDRLVIPMKPYCMKNVERLGKIQKDGKTYLAFKCQKPVDGNPGSFTEVTELVRYETDKYGNAQLPDEYIPNTLKVDEAHRKDIKHVMEAAFWENLNLMDMELIALSPDGQEMRLDKDEMLEFIAMGSPVILRPPGSRLDGYGTYKRVLISDIYSKEYLTKVQNNEGGIDETRERYGSLASFLYGKSMDKTRYVPLRDVSQEEINDLWEQLKTDGFEKFENTENLEEYLKDAVAAKHGFLIYNPNTLKDPRADDDFQNAMRELYLSSKIKPNKVSGYRDLPNGTRTKQSAFDLYLDTVKEYTDGDQYQKLQERMVEKRQEQERKGLSSAKGSFDSAPITIEDLKKNRRTFYEWLMDPLNNKKDDLDKWEQKFASNVKVSPTEKREFAQLVAKLNYQWRDTIFEQMVQKQKNEREFRQLRGLVNAGLGKLKSVLANNKNYLDDFIKKDSGRLARYEKLKTVEGDLEDADSLSDKIGILKEANENIQAFTGELHEEYLEELRLAEAERQKKLGPDSQRLIEDTDIELSDNDNQTKSITNLQTKSITNLQTKSITNLEREVSDRLNVLKQMMIENQSLESWIHNSDEFSEIFSRWNNYDSDAEPEEREKVLSSLKDVLDELDRQMNPQTAINDFGPSNDNLWSNSLSTVVGSNSNSQQINIFNHNNPQNDDDGIILGQSQHISMTPNIGSFEGNWLSSGYNVDNSNNNFNSGGQTNFVGNWNSNNNFNPNNGGGQLSFVNNVSSHDYDSTDEELEK